MLHNGLVLNPDKSEAILFETSRAIASSKIKSVTVAGSAVTISDEVKSLGVTLNKCLSFDSQVKATCKAIHYHARSLRHIRRSLPDTLAKSIASTIVARLDYCNSIHVGTSDANFQRLQIAQNAAARVISGIRKYEHIRPVLCSHHWLSVEYQIKFKIAVTTFSIRQFGEPAYLASLLHDNVSVRSLRSSDKSFLDVPRRWIEIAKRTFSFAAPTIWNSLPVHLCQLDTITVSKSSFKEQLKTHLFHFANSTLSLSAKVVLRNS